MGRLEKLDRAELVPGKLGASLYKMTLPDGEPGRVMVSHGMERVGQQELLFVLRWPESGLPAGAMASLAMLFGTVHSLAEQGHFVGDGGQTVLAEGQRLDVDPRISGFLYEERPVPPIRVEAEGATRPPLIVVPMLAGEMPTAMAFGQSRVLTLLGRHARYYPYPWWFDGRRDPVADAAAHRGASLLDKMARMPASYVEVVQRGQRLDIAVHDEQRSSLHRALAGAPDVLALLTGIAGGAEMTYVWQPGQTGPQAIGGQWSGDGGAPVVRPTDPIGGNYLSIGHGKVEAMAAQREDGFMVLLPKKTWKQFTKAVKDGRPFGWDVPGTEIRQVTVGFPTAAERGRVVAQPPEGAAVPARPVGYHVGLESVELLQDQVYVGEAITAQDHAGFVRHVEQVVDDVFAGHEVTCERMMVEFQLAPGRPPEPTIATQGDPIPREFGNALHERLRALPPPPVRQPFGFRAFFLFAAQSSEQ